MSVLETKNITKVYPGTIALKDVSVSFDSGRVHALVGKNGSGKSTLIKIFSGAIEPTSGEVLLDGSPIKFNNPMDALKEGIATVYQELSLVPGLSVAENILIGRLPMRGHFIDWKKTYSLAGEILNELEIDISPHKMVGDLSLWQCQMIEIAKAMSFKPKVIQLDEPTSSLAKNEIKLLFKMINNLKKKGVIIIYVSHKLHELWQIADTCTVLRDGLFVGYVEMKDTSHKQLLNMMFGDVEVLSRPLNLVVSKEVVLAVKDLTLENKFSGVSFELRKGEILGIAGMLGSGRSELLKAIFGAERFNSGEVMIEGRTILSPNPIKMKKAGLAFTPEDRKKEGLNLIGGIDANLCYASLDLIAKGAFVRKDVEKTFVDCQVKNLGIKVSSTERPVSSLSGGNQQKVVVGNWLNTNPKVIIFDEPSRGIDINAKQQIFQIMWDLSRKGVSSIIVSSELEELLEVCHRILIMRDGQIIKEVFPENLKIEDLYSLCMGDK